MDLPALLHIVLFYLDKPEFHLYLQRLTCQLVWLGRQVYHWMQAGYPNRDTQKWERVEVGLPADDFHLRESHRMLPPFLLKSKI
jgi:hypothetical protein